MIGIWMVPAGITLIALNEAIFGFEHFRLSIFSYICGFSLPHLMWLARARVETILLKDRPFGSFLLNFVTLLADATIKYPHKIVADEENEVKKELLPADYDQCVSKAYEFHRVEIARHVSHNPPESMFKLVNKAEKIDYLMRFLGIEHAPAFLTSIKQDPSIVFPDWGRDKNRRIKPVSDQRRCERRESVGSVENDQRTNYSDRRKMPIWGRRRADSPYALRFALD